MKMYIYYITIQERSNFYLVQRTVKATDCLDLTGLGVVSLLFVFHNVKSLRNATLSNHFTNINFTVRAKVIFHFIAFVFA